MLKMAKLKKVLVTVVTSLRRNKNAAFRKSALFLCRWVYIDLDYLFCDEAKTSFKGRVIYYQLGGGGGYIQGGGQNFFLVMYWGG